MDYGLLKRMGSMDSYLIIVKWRWSLVFGNNPYASSSCRRGLPPNGAERLKTNEALTGLLVCAVVKPMLSLSRLLKSSLPNCALVFVDLGLFRGANHTLFPCSLCLLVLVLLVLTPEVAAYLLSCSPSLLFLPRFFLLMASWIYMSMTSRLPFEHIYTNQRCTDM